MKKYLNYMFYHWKILMMIKYRKYTSIKEDIFEKPELACYKRLNHHYDKGHTLWSLTFEKVNLNMLPVYRSLFEVCDEI